MPINSSRLLVLALLAAPGGASAQNSPAPELVPGLDRFDLAPRAQPTPAPSAAPTRAPTPRPTRVPAPRASATPTPAAPEARRERDTPAPVPTPTPTVAAPRPTPTPTSPPVVTAAPAPVESAPTASLPAPASIPTAPLDTPAAAVDQPATAASGSGSTTRWIAILILAALALAAAYLWRRRRRAAAERFTLDVDRIAEPEAALPPARPMPDMPSPASFPPASPLQPAAPPSPTPVFLNDSPHAAPRAMLELTVRPIRAGTNLTSAAVDYEIDIRNSGEAAATGILLDLRLLSASADQDRILSTLYAAPIDKPIIAPFEVAAGEQVSLGGMAMLPREALGVLSAQGRDFFVPLLSVNLVYGWGGAATGQTASAHIVGIEREGGGKMAPFRLDTGPRMYDGVGAREHTLTVRH